MSRRGSAGLCVTQEEDDDSSIFHVPIDLYTLAIYGQTV